MIIPYILPGLFLNKKDDGPTSISGYYKQPFFLNRKFVSDYFAGKIPIFQFCYTKSNNSKCKFRNISSNFL